MELHVFDFDGTIFNSPTPRVEEVAASHGREVADRLWNPVVSGGYGWFQSPATLGPPVVPERPDIDRWFIAPVVARLKALGRAGPSSAAADAPSSDRGKSELDMVAGTRRAVHCFVLTGRDEKYRTRIEGLLDHAGLLPLLTNVFLKPHETAGTVKYKLNTLFHLICMYHPSRVFYYEDRPEQGGTLYEGIRSLQEAMYGANTSSALASVASAAAAPTSGEEEGEEVPPLSSLVWLPTSSEQSTPSTIAFMDLFNGDKSHEWRAVRAGRRWAADAVGELNRRERELVQPSQHPDIGGHVAPLRRPRSVLDVIPSEKDGCGQPLKKNNGNEEDGIDAATFPTPPQFTFTMVMIPSALSGQSEQMLSADEQRTVVDTLIDEREAYDSGNDAYAAYRGPGTGIRPPSNRGGGGYGGRGRHSYNGPRTGSYHSRGYEVFRGAGMRSRGGGNGRGSYSAAAAKTTTAASPSSASKAPPMEAYPTLPPA